MGYLARIWKGEAKGAMDSTITMTEVICKRHKGHGTIPILSSSPAKRGDFDASIHTLVPRASLA